MGPPRGPQARPAKGRPSALEALKAALKSDAGDGEDERAVGGDESFSEALSKEVFTNYKCQADCLQAARPHPGDIAEAASLR